MSSGLSNSKFGLGQVLAVMTRHSDPSSFWVEVAMAHVVTIMSWCGPYRRSSGYTSAEHRLGLSVGFHRLVSVPILIGQGATVSVAVISAVRRCALRGSGLGCCETKRAPSTGMGMVQALKDWV